MANRKHTTLAKSKLLQYVEISQELVPQSVTLYDLGSAVVPTGASIDTTKEYIKTTNGGSTVKYYRLEGKRPTKYVENTNEGGLMQGEIGLNISPKNEAIYAQSYDGSGDVVDMAVYRPITDVITIKSSDKRSTSAIAVDKFVVPEYVAVASGTTSINLKENKVYEIVGTVMQSLTLTVTNLENIMASGELNTRPTYLYFRTGTGSSFIEPATINITSGNHITWVGFGDNRLAPGRDYMIVLQNGRYNVVSATPENEADIVYIEKSRRNAGNQNEQIEVTIYRKDRNHVAPTNGTVITVVFDSDITDNKRLVLKYDADTSLVKSVLKSDTASDWFNCSVRPIKAHVAYRFYYNGTDFICKDSYAIRSVQGTTGINVTTTGETATVSLKPAATNEIGGGKVGEVTYRGYDESFVLPTISPAANTYTAVDGDVTITNSGQTKIVNFGMVTSQPDKFTIAVSSFPIELNITGVQFKWTIGGAVHTASLADINTGLAVTYPTLRSQAYSVENVFGTPVNFFFQVGNGGNNVYLNYTSFVPAVGEYLFIDSNNRYYIPTAMYGAGVGLWMNGAHSINLLTMDSDHLGGAKVYADISGTGKVLHPITDSTEEDANENAGLREYNDVDSADQVTYPKTFGVEINNNYEEHHNDKLKVTLRDFAVGADFYSKNYTFRETYEIKASTPYSSSWLTETQGSYTPTSVTSGVAMDDVIFHVNGNIMGYVGPIDPYNSGYGIDVIWTEVNDDPTLMTSKINFGETEVITNPNGTAYENGWFMANGDVIYETAGTHPCRWVRFPDTDPYYHRYFQWNGLDRYDEVSPDCIIYQGQNYSWGYLTHYFKWDGQHFRPLQYNPEDNKVYYEYARNYETIETSQGSGVYENVVIIKCYTLDPSNDRFLDSENLVPGYRYQIILKERIPDNYRIAFDAQYENQPLTVRAYDDFLWGSYLTNNPTDIPTNIVLEFECGNYNGEIYFQYNGIANVYQTLSQLDHREHRTYVIKGPGDYEGSGDGQPKRFLREDGTWQETIGAVNQITFNNGLGDANGNPVTVNASNPIATVQLNTASTSAFGGIKVSAIRPSSQSIIITSGGTTGANYGVELNSSGTGFVNIPWDTVITNSSSNGKITVNGSDVDITGWSDKADVASPTFTGTPSAPTAAAGTSTTQLATTEFVMNAFRASDAMIFKGTIGAAVDNPTITVLPNVFDAGWTYKVVTAGTYAGQVCEVGDMIIATIDRASGTTQNSDWAVIQTNIDGAVTSSSQSSTNLHVAVFDGTSGKIIKDSGYTISKSVPSDAEFTDTKVTSAANHYTPTAESYTPSSETWAWGETTVITGVKKDSKGHIVDIIVSKIDNPDSGNTATAADNILHGSNIGTEITYAPYTSQQTNRLSFDTGSVNPSRTDRLNLNGNLYATNMYSNGRHVEIVPAITTISSASVSQTIAENTVYKCSANVTSMTLNVSNLVTNPSTYESIVYFRTANDFNLTLTGAGTIIGTQILKGNKNYVVAIKDGVTTISTYIEQTYGTVTSVSTGTGLTGGPITGTGQISLKAATTGEIGGAKVAAHRTSTITTTQGGTTAERYYGIETDGNNKLFVNVPWENTEYSLPLAADGTRGGIQIGFTTSAANRNYALQLNNTEKAYVNVPWTDETVSDAAHHYTPESDEYTPGTSTWEWGGNAVVDIEKDEKGHITKVVTAKIENPNTDRYVNSAAFADDTTNTPASPVKMTLTRAGSDSSTVVANIPKVSNTTAGVAPKGETVSEQSQSTKFLRSDGTWATPSYTVNTDEHVTSAANHYTPSTVEYTPTAGSWTWGSTKAVVGITKDDKGHITGVTTTSIANPNTDEKVDQKLSDSNKNYPIIFSSTETSNADGVFNGGTLRSNSIYINPSIGNIQATKFNGYVLNEAATKAVSTTVTQNEDKLITSGAVWTAIDNLPEPMVFKGTVGTGGTVTTLPTANSSHEGWTYKVITDGTYASQSAKVGDTFICAKTGDSTYAWVIIPSGDEPSGTVTNIATGVGLVGGPITSTGTIKANLVDETENSNQAVRSTSEEGGLYAVEIDADKKLAVRVPWTDTSTTKTGHYTPSTTDTYTPTEGSWTWDSTYAITDITKDSKGHIIGVTRTQISNPNTNTATAADNILRGSNSGTEITYAPYTAQQSNKISFDTSSTNPAYTGRLNVNANLYATNMYSGGKLVEVVPTVTTISSAAVSQTMAANTVYKCSANVTSMTLNVTSLVSSPSTYESIIYFKTANDLNLTLTGSGVVMGSQSLKGNKNYAVVVKDGVTTISSYIEQTYGTVTSVSTGTGLQGGPITGTGQISLKAATTSEIGGVKVAAHRSSAITTTQGGTTAERYYGVETDSNNKMFVNVPWENTEYSLPLAANGTRGGIQIGFTTSAANRNYALQLNNVEKAYVNVPWTDETVSDAAHHYEPVSDTYTPTEATWEWGGNVIVEVEKDEKGHITKVTTAKIENPNTDTSVTSAANHYTPTSVEYIPTAGSWTWDSTSVVTSITKDSKGHITGVTTTSIANPNTDRYVNSATFADDTTADANNPLKLTLTRAGSDTNTVTANAPKVSSTTAGVAPKGEAVSTQLQSTKFLRSDGTWAAPSYTTNTDRYVNSAAFEDVTATDAEKPIKMTLTRAGSDSATVTANIPKVSPDTPGVAPKGETVSGQTQETKFLRSDGTWAAPSYTTNSNTWRGIYTGGTSRVGNAITTKAMNFSAGDNVTITYEAAGTGSGKSGSSDYFNVKISSTNTWNANALNVAGYVAAPTSATTNKVWRTDGSGNPSWGDFPTVVTGVKGNSESSYRTGDVNITKSNIGLSNVTNDAQVKGLASGTTEDHIVVWGADGYTVKDGTYKIASDVPSGAVFTDTWNANALNVAGYVAAPTSSTTNQVWMTDNTGAPAWRTMSTAYITNERFVRYDTASQGLTAAQKTNARTNIKAAEEPDVVVNSSATSISINPVAANTIYRYTNASGVSSVVLNVTNLLTNPSSYESLVYFKTQNASTAVTFTGSTASTPIFGSTTLRANTNYVIAIKDGAITISTYIEQTYGTVTSVSTGTGLQGGPITSTGQISLKTAATGEIGGVKVAAVRPSPITTAQGGSEHLYGVEIDSTGKAFVNVPWSDTFTPATNNPENVSTTASIGTQNRYAREDHVHAISLATGDNKGQVKIAGTNVDVNGLDTGAYYGVSTTVTQNEDKLITSGAVWTAIDNLPEAMVFKGTVGTGGTVTTLPTAASGNEGWTYKVITDGTYASKSAKVGDTFICAKTGSSTYEWVLIPSGDEPSGTVTNIATGTGLTGGPVTSTGTIKAKLRSGDTLNTEDSSQSTSTSGGLYSVEADKSGYLAVRVPWVNDDNKVLQTPTTSSNTSWRPVIIGDSYSDAATFAPSLVTSGTYATHLAKFAPKDGVLALVGLKRMKIDGTMDTASNSNLWNTNGGVTTIGSSATLDTVNSIDLGSTVTNKVTTPKAVNDFVVPIYDGTTYTGASVSITMAENHVYKCTNAGVTSMIIDVKNMVSGPKTRESIVYFHTGANPALSITNNGAAFIGMIFGNTTLESNKDYAIAVKDGAVTISTYIVQAYGTVTSVSTGTGLQGGPITGVGQISLKTAATGEIGGVKAAAVRSSAITTTQGGTTAGRYYGVELDSTGKAFVNVPWSNTEYTVNDGTFKVYTQVDETSTTVSGSSANQSDDTVLTFVQGNNITLTPDPSEGTITISATNTWNANAVNVAGYVAAPTASTSNKVWKTNANGVPAWRDDSDTWNANALNVAGYVAAPTSSTTNKVWRTDGSGNPSWGDFPTVVTGVKGNSETTYRTGDVNITKTNIGLGYVTNDAQVKGLASGTTEDHIVVWGADGYTVKDGTYKIASDVPSNAVFTDTWNANAVGVAGYVAAPSASTSNKVWKTNASGVPDWRDDANDNTATAADNIFKGSNSGTEITYAPYSSQQTNRLSFDTGSIDPSRTDRLNLNGNLYATNMYSGGKLVEVVPTVSTISSAAVSQTMAANTIYKCSTNVTSMSLNVTSLVTTPSTYESIIYFKAANDFNLSITGSPVILGSTAIKANKNYAIVMKDGRLTISTYIEQTYGTVTSISTGTGLTGGPITSTGQISLKTAATGEIGGIRVGAAISGASSASTTDTDAAKRYAVLVDGNGLGYVNVPWSSGGAYTLPLAADGTRGGIQIGFTTSEANRNYALQLSSEKGYVNVPWTDEKVRQIPSNTNYDYNVIVTGNASNEDESNHVRFAYTSSDASKKVTVNPSEGTVVAKGFRLRESDGSKCTTKKILVGDGTSITAPSTTDTYLKYNGSAFEWAAVTSGGGTVTSVDAGVGLATSTGSAIQSSGSLKAKLLEETANTANAVRNKEDKGGLYAVEVDKTGYLAVRVPWENTTYSVNDAKMNFKMKVGNTTTTIADFTANQSGNDDDVTLIQGTNVKLTGSTQNRTITIAATDTTYSISSGSGTNGKKSGIILTPSSGAAQTAVVKFAATNTHSGTATAVSGETTFDEILLYQGTNITFKKIVESNRQGLEISATGGGSGGGSVTSVGAGYGLNTTSGDTTSDGGSFSTSGSLYLTKVNSNPGSFGPSTNPSPSAGGTFSVPYITVDKAGRVTAASTKTVTLPQGGGGASLSTTWFDTDLSGVAGTTIPTISCDAITAEAAVETLQAGPNSIYLPFNSEDRELEYVGIPVVQDKHGRLIVALPMSFVTLIADGKWTDRSKGRKQK